MSIQQNTFLAISKEEQNAPTSKWVEGFFAVQICCQIALMIPGLGPVRTVLRVASFGASLFMAGWITPRYRKHPASWLAMGVMALLGLSILHPNTNNLTSGLAQTAIYAAILAPLFWVSGLKVDTAGMRRILLILWGFHAASVLVGVQQVVRPEWMTPTVSSVVAAQGDWYVEDMKITLANGMRVFRPMGLSDYPGAAGTSGFFVVLIGMGLWMSEKNQWIKNACLISLPIGLFCIYLSQMRSMLVMTGVCSISLIVLLAIKGDMKRVLSLLTTLVIVSMLSFGWAAWVGGEAVTKRLSSLIEDKPTNVYQSNRGHFLTQTIEEYVPAYPLGAGLGRWGMMNYYFGEAHEDPHRGDLWAEIQWTGWVFDGGVPMVLLYCGAIGMAFYIAGQAALSHRPGVLPLFAAIVFAYNLGALAMTFNYALFIGQSGLEFWVINSCLFAAWIGAGQPKWVRIKEEIPAGPKPVSKKLLGLKLNWLFKLRAQN